MKRIAFYFRLYIKLVTAYVKTRMQYRFDFFMSSVGMLIYYSASIASLWVLMTNMPSLAGWSFTELIFIYSFSLMAQIPLQICFEHIWSLRMHVRQGTFIKYYFRPIDSLFYYLSELIDMKGLGQIPFSIALFAWSSHALGVAWTPAVIALLILLLFGSAAVISSLMLIAASTAFWVTDSFSVISFVNGIRDHTRYPMDIYNTAFKFVFTWLIPMGFVAFYPAQFFLRPNAVDWTAFASPVIGIALFIVARLVWKKGMESWGGTGS